MWQVKLIEVEQKIPKNKFKRMENKQLFYQIRQKKRFQTKRQFINSLNEMESDRIIVGHTQKTWAQSLLGKN